METPSRLGCMSLDGAPSLAGGGGASKFEDGI